MQLSPPTPPCGCHEATLQLRSNISATAIHPTPSTSPKTPCQQPSPSLALLQGRAISEHWTRITFCPYSTSHLSSPTVLRCTARAMKRIIAHYEFFIKRMLNTGPSPYAAQDGHDSLLYLQNTYHFTQHDDDTASEDIDIDAQVDVDLTNDPPLKFDSTSFIGNQPLEDDEASILFQEAVRQSMMQVSVIMRDVQRAIDNRRMQVEYERGRRQMDWMGDYDDDEEGMDEGQEAARIGENASLVRLPDVGEMGVLTMRAYEIFKALDELARREF